MKSTTIIKGHFATGTDENTGRKKQGNFFCSTANGTQIHVSKEDMKSLGYEKDADVVFPFYAIYVEKKYSARMADGTISNEDTFSRNDATAVFKDSNEMNKVMIADRMMLVQQLALIKAEATTAGLDQTSVNRLVESSI